MNQDYSFATNDLEYSSTDFLSYGPSFLGMDDLSASTPPPLDPGAEGDEDMENEDDETDLGAISSFGALGTLNAYSGIPTNATASSDGQQASKVAFADELPMSLDKNNLFGDSLSINDFDFDLQASIYQAFSSEFDVDKVLAQNNIPNNSQESTPAVKPEPVEDINATMASTLSSIDNSSTLSHNSTPDSLTAAMQEPLAPFLSSTSPVDLESASSTLSTPSTSPASSHRRTLSISSQQQHLPRRSVLSMQSRTAAAAVAAATCTSLPKEDPARTDEERKRRNRVYAKRSRDLKNQKYRDSMVKNKDLESRINMVTKENQELKMENQRLEFLLKEMRQKLILHGIPEKDDISKFRICAPNGANKC